jgi:hypothetical protein
MAFGEVGRLGQPIIHLDVDVGVVIAAPWRVITVVPKPLQVGRQATLAR